MSKIKLDLSKFKHVKSDAKTTTLQHTSDGHQLTLVHDALSKEAKGQLDALSKMSKESMTNSQAQEAQDQKPKMAEGEEVKKPKKDDKKSPETIQETDAANGVKAANEVRKNKDLPHGATILIEKVKKYAEGGMIDDIVKAVQDYHNASDPDKPKPEVNRDPNQKKAAQVSSEVRGYADGGGVSGYLTGQLPEESQNELTQPITHVPTNPNELDVGAMKERSLQTEIDKLKGSQDSTAYTGQDPALMEQEALKNIEAQQEAKHASEKAALAKAQADLAQINAQRAKLGMAPKDAIQSDRMPQAEGEPQAASEAQQTPGEGGAVSALMPKSSGLGASSTDPESMVHEGYNQQIQGIQEEADAIGDLGKAQAAAINQTVKAQQEAQDHYKQAFDSLNQERLAAIQDVKNGYINPEQYWTGDKDGNGSHSKIAAGIGMILAGFNPAGTPNAAINFLKSQMEMNIQAQARNLGAKETLLSHNMQQFHNLKDATDMTRIMQNDMLAHQLDSAAAQAKTPMAQAAAKQAAGKLTTESATLFQNFAMRRAMMGMGSEGSSSEAVLDQMINYARMTNPELAKDMQSRRVPGIPALAKIPVPEQVRKEMTSQQALINAGQDLLNYSKTHTNLVPGTAEYNYGVTKAMAFQQAVRDGLLGTVFRESEKPLLEKFVKENPAGAFKIMNTQPQIRAILDSTMNSLNTTKRSLGLPVSAPTQDNNPQKALAWAKANINDPKNAAKAQQILKVLGH